MKRYLNKYYSVIKDQALLSTQILEEGSFEFSNISFLLLTKFPINVEFPFLSLIIFQIEYQKYFKIRIAVLQYC